jgi:hypothetical protein
MYVASGRGSESAMPQIPFLSELLYSGLVHKLAQVGSIRSGQTAH